MRCKMIVIIIMLCLTVACQKGQAKPTIVNTYKPKETDTDKLKEIANTVLSRPGAEDMSPEQIAILAAGEAMLEKQIERMFESGRIIDEAFENFQFAKALADIDKARMCIRKYGDFGIEGAKEYVDWIDVFIYRLGDKLYPYLFPLPGDITMYGPGITYAAILQGTCSNIYRNSDYDDSLYDFTEAYIDLLFEVGILEKQRY